MTTNNMTNNFAGGTSIIQVVAVDGGGSSTSSLAAVDITGSSVTITPTSAANRIYIYASFSCDVPGLGGADTYMYIQCLRGAGVINGTPYAQIGTDSSAGDCTFTGTVGFMFLDAPATVAATTYKFQQYSSSASISVTTSNVNVTVMEVIA